MITETMSSITADRVLKAWSGMRQAIAHRTLSENSAIRYGAIWTNWNEFVSGRGLTWHNAQSADVRDFLLAIPPHATTRGVNKPSAVTQKRYFKILMELYACALANDWIDKSPVDSEAAVSKTEAHESLVFHRVHWQHLLDALPEVRNPPLSDTHWTEVRNLAVLVLMMHAGLSVGELASLDVADVSSSRARNDDTLEKNIPSEPKKTVKTETVLRLSGSRPNQARELVLDEKAEVAVLAWLSLRVDMPLNDGMQSPLFISRKGAGRLTLKTLFILANEHIQKTLGSELGQVALAHAGPMTLRNSCIVRWLDAGTSDREVLRRAGLKDEQALGRLRKHVIHRADLNHDCICSTSFF
ncbi:MAG: hypothetical protein V4713_12210 [Pseudomonadota bacterium]